MKQFFLAFLFPFFTSAFSDYVYMVGYDENKKLVYFCHQEELFVLKLYQYDYINKESRLLLPSYFIPAAFRLLPNGNGFSFIQNDSLYIKDFSKRSPKRIEFFEPIYAINAIEWIDTENFYFAARQGQHYGIYQANIEGDVQCILHRNGDYFYPQKVEEQLFCIQRDSEKKYRIIQAEYDCTTNQTIIADFDDQAIACLSMISQKEGFFLGYAHEIDPKKEILEFSYFYLKKNKTWETSLLFTFQIPKSYLVGDDRLNESIIPFLPYYYEGTLHFSSFTNTKKLEKYNFVYNLKKNMVMQKAHDNNDLIVSFTGTFFEKDFWKV